MKIAVIGSTRIASIHIISLLKSKHENKIKKIYSISRQLRKSKEFLFKYNFINNDKIISADYKILDEYKFVVIIICVNTNYHHSCIDRVKKCSAILLVEKPLVSISLLGKKYNKIINKIYKDNNKLAVCYPMKYFARSIKKNFNFEKPIKKIELNYTTNGQHKNTDIRDDLLPHALSFLYEFFRDKKEFKHIKLESRMTQNFWQGKIYYKNLKFIMNFKQTKIKNSKFYVKINNTKVDRITKIVKNQFLTMIVFKKKKVIVKNPMHSFIDSMFDNKSNSKWFIKNFKTTKEFLKINYLFSL